MAYKPTFPDLTHLGTRDAATRFAKKQQSRRQWKNRGYIYEGRLITPEGSKNHSIWRDSPERNKRFWRDVEGKPGSQLQAQLNKEAKQRVRKRGHSGTETYSSPEQKLLSLEKKAKIKEYNRVNKLKPSDPGFQRIEHRIQLANDTFWNSPKGKAAGRPDDGWNLIATTNEQWAVKDALERKLASFPHIVDVDEVSGNLRVVNMDEFQPDSRGIAIGEEIFLDTDLDEVANGFKNQAVSDWMDATISTKPARMIGRGVDDLTGRPTLNQLRTTPDGFPIDEAFESAIQQELKNPNNPKLHMRDRIENTLSKPFDYDAQGLEKHDYHNLGVWHDADTLKDSWIKVSRDLNTETGKFNDATGEFIYDKDPTARATIDIQSDIGQGKGKYSDIVNLKNKFQTIKRTLPPGEYIMHADDYTKAMYYLRAFKDDPWISKSGEEGGQRLINPDGSPGEYVKYDTLKLTVPDLETQRQDVLTGKYQNWQKQGVPQTSLTGAKLDGNPLQSVSEIARRNKVQMSAVTSDLSTAMRRAGSVLPFIGAGLDAWDVQQRWEEMIDNPNEGFADYMDKVQFGLASATLGTSFWAEPANFVLGMTNLGIDVARTIAEEDKRNNFVKNMRAIGRGTTYAAQQLL